MTTRVFQGGIAALTEGETDVRVFQGGIAVLLETTPPNSAPRVFQSGIAALVRTTKYSAFLNWKPACSVQIDPAKQDL